VFVWIKEKIVAAWRWSRTVFLNVIAAILPLAGEIVGYLANVEWSSLTSNPKAAVAYSVGLTVLNIVLRFITTAPVGKKEA
jgi:hypothetical protein